MQVLEDVGQALRKQKDAIRQQESFVRQQAQQRQQQMAAETHRIRWPACSTTAYAASSRYISLAVLHAWRPGAAAKAADGG